MEGSHSSFSAWLQHKVELLQGKTETQGKRGGCSIEAVDSTSNIPIKQFFVLTAFLMKHGVPVIPLRHSACSSHLPASLVARNIWSSNGWQTVNTWGFLTTISPHKSEHEKLFNLCSWKKENTTLWIYYIFSKVASSLKLNHGSQLKSLKIYKPS